MITPWFANPPDSQHAEAAEWITSLWLIDASLGETVARLPWVVDGISKGDSNNFSQEWETLHLTLFIAEKDLRLVMLMVGYTWFIDDANTGDVRMLEVINNNAINNPELARTALDLRLEITTGNLADNEQSHSELVEIARYDTQFALTAAEYANNQKGDLSGYLLTTLADLTRSEGAIEQLVTQHWFADGLNAEEAAFIVPLSAVRNRFSDAPNLYSDLLETHFTQARTVSLPLAGDVNIWVFQGTPFLPDEYLPTAVADAARMVEGLFGEPFPSTDIILLMPRSDLYNIGGGASHYGRYMLVSRDRESDLHHMEPPLGTIAHETGHYYFSGRMPRWLVEGGASTITAYFNDRRGYRDINESRIYLSNSARIYAYQYGGIANISHCLYHSSFFLPTCFYGMGANFLVTMLDAIGENPVGAALREIYLLEKVGIVTEELAYDIFLKHTPPDLREEFLDIYRELHGGPNLPDIPDDHGDSVEAATYISTEETVEGMLDYKLDLDFFRFHAEEGREYRINVTHETLRRTSIWMYSSSGDDLASRNEDEHWKSELVPSGPQIRWIAPTSGEYCVSVEDFAGESGSYTLTITPQ